jgi:hypothetical protein
MYIKQLDTVDDLRDADRDVPRIYNEGPVEVRTGAGARPRPSSMKKEKRRKEGRRKRKSPRMRK